MDINNIYEKINLIELKCLTEKEKHFSEFVATDYIEMMLIFQQPSSQEHLYIIDDYDWYLYFLDVARDLNEIITLIISNELFKNSECRQYLNKAVNLKREIDKTLLNLSKGDKNRIYADLDLFFANPTIENKKNNNPFIKLNPKEVTPEETVKNLHKLLKRKGLISQDIESSFRNHFQKSGSNEFIVWEDNMTNLVRLMVYLSNQGFIVNKIPSLPYLIITHFKLSEKEFNQNSLKRTISKINNREEQDWSERLPSKKEVDNCF